MTPNRNITKDRDNEEGFVLVGALLILMLLMIIGISATTNTSLELQIAGNDRTHKETFYQADGGSQLAVRLVEESLGTPGGFTKHQCRQCTDCPDKSQQFHTDSRQNLIGK